MTVNEATERYRGEWVLMRVTEYDEDHWPARGYVLAHSAKRIDITEAVKREPPASNAAGDLLYVFEAVPLLRSGPKYESAMRRLAADFITLQAERDARKRR